MANIIGHLIAKVGADISEFSEAIGVAEGQLKTVSSSMANIGQKMSLGVTAPIVGIGAAALSSAADLNEGLANVASLGVAGDRINELREDVQTLQVDVGKTATDLTDGLYQVVSAFGDSADTAEILRINAMGAAAGLATTGQAIALTSAVTKNYGDTSAEAVQATTDLAFTAVRLGQTTFPELAGAMGRVAGMSKSLGVSQEELFGVMAASTGVMGSASEVSTQLSGLYTAMMAPTENLAALISDLGFANSEAMIGSLGLQGSIAAIVDAATASDQPLQSYIGSIEGQRLAIGLAGELAGDYESKLGEMANASGAAAAAFAAQSEGVNSTSFQMQQLRQQITTVGADLGQTLVPALASVLEAATPVIQGIANLAQRFSEMDPKQQKIILGAIGLAAAIGPIAGVVSSVITVVGVVTPLISGLAAVIGAVVSPALLVGAAIGAIVAVLADWATGGEMLPAMLESWGLEGMAEKLSVFYGWLDKGAAKLSEWGAATFSWGLEGLSEMLSTVHGWLEKGATKLGEWGTATFSWGLEGLSETLSTVHGWLDKGAAKLSEWGAATFSWGLEGLSEMLSTVHGWLEKGATKLGEWGTATFSWGLEGLSETLSTVHGWLEKGATKLSEWGEVTFSSFGEFTAPAWVDTLLAWAWPTLANIDWVDALLTWGWPLLGPVGWAIKLTNWSWPTLSQPGWIGSLFKFKWPGFPSRPRWLGGGGDEDVGENASGTPSWRGGVTWVGEEGPELINLPRGTAIYPADASAAMASPTININNPTIRSDADIRTLARAVGRELQRMHA